MSVSTDFVVVFGAKHEAAIISFALFFRFCLEEPPGVQKVYDRPSTPPPTKVTCLSDKEQKDWVKDVQGITEQ